MGRRRRVEVTGHLSVEQLFERYRSARGELWAEDEARLGLIPIVHRIWARRGERPRALGQRRYQWLYLYGFVRPGGGKVQWLILPEVNTDLFSLALKHFADAVGAGPNRRILLVIDRAGWHVANDLVVPDGIHFAYLAPVLAGASARRAPLAARA